LERKMRDITIIPSICICMGYRLNELSFIHCFSLDSNAN